MSGLVALTAPHSALSRIGGPGPLHVAQEFAPAGHHVLLVAFDGLPFHLSPMNPISGCGWLLLPVGLILSRLSVALVTAVGYAGVVALGVMAA